MAQNDSLNVGQATQNLTADSMTLLNDASQWLAAHWIEVLIAGAVGVGIALGLLALRAFGHKLISDEGEGLFWQNIVGRALAKTSMFFIVMCSAEIVAKHAATPPSLLSVVNFLFVVAAAFQGAIWARELILGFVQHRVGSEPDAHGTLNTAMGLIRMLVTVALFAIASILILDNLGVNVTGLVAGLGVGGIAIGLAAQGIFADLFAALAIIFDRPFRRGDVIAYDDTNGTVESIGLKSTRVRGVDGEQRIISNKNLLDKEVRNNTQRERRRTKFTLGLAYETPVDVLENFPATIKQVVEECGLTYVRCGFFQFGASSLDFDIEFDSMSPEFAASFESRHKVGIAILRKCNEMGVNIPFPIQTAYTAAPDGKLIMPYAQRAEPDEDATPSTVRRLSGRGS